MWRKMITLICLLFVAAQSFAADTPQQRLPRRWLFVMRNLRVAENVERTLDLLPRAAAAGYNAIVLSDGSLYRPEQAEETYRENVRRIQQVASSYGLELIPCLMPIGYSGAIVGRDSNLAEGVPVKDAPFLVQAETAVFAPDPSVTLPGGGFDDCEGNRFAGWDWQDNEGESIFADREVIHSGRASARMENIGQADPVHGHCRFCRTIEVHSFRQYHLRAWIKTEGFEAPDSAQITVLAGREGDRTVSFAELAVEPTQDWTEYHLLFNSLDCREVRIYLGTWGGKGGRIWWDDVELEEVGLLNVLRRPGCPVSVRGEDGTAYEEGRDFEPIHDPQLRPWEAYHEPPVIRLTSDSRLKQGQRIRVSYYHSMLIGRWQIMCCLSDPKVYDILREQVIAVNDLLHPSAFFMQHDEIRVANWDEACQSRGLTPGQLLADNVRRCREIIREVRPDAEIWVWSDMFDPMHNAVDNYYLVNGTWAGSWEGLSPDVGIVNWANHLKGENLRWFSGRGHNQVLAGYYDYDNDGAGITEWLEAGGGVPGVSGAMYTTWQDNYDHMEAWAAAAWGGEAGPSSEEAQP